MASPLFGSLFLTEVGQSIPGEGRSRRCWCNLGRQKGVLKVSQN